MKRIYLVLGVLIAFWAGGCEEDVSIEEQAAIDRAIIDEYIAENGLEGEFTENGIFVSLEDPGVGTETPTTSSVVEVIYKGMLIDGTVFDSSDGFPADFFLGNTISGWREGIPYFKRESKGTLVIPSRYGYGTRGTFTIPGNSVLVFEIELLDFN